MKPVLIIGCSKRKLSGTHKALKLYTGHVYQLLSKNVPNPLESYDIFILSGRYGLISAHEVIETYEQTIPSKKNLAAVADYCNKHQAKALAAFASIQNKQHRELMLFLTGDYQVVMDKWLELHAFKTEMTKFKQVDVCRNFGGIGVFRGRLKEALLASRDRYLDAKIA
ncbi:DUF6884 domain-containing protein [Vibrio mediterranei]